MLILRRFLGYLRRIIRFFIRFLNSLKWRMLFKYFGRNSQLISPLRLDGTENIIIGDYVSVGYKTWLAALPLTGEKECVLELQDRVTIGHFNHIFSTKRIVIESDVITAGKVYISDNFPFHVSNAFCRFPTIQFKLSTSYLVIFHSNITFYFISPRIPSWHFFSCKKFNSWQISN